MTIRSDRKLWTDEEWATLQRMRADGASWAEVDKALGRPPRCSRSKWENEQGKIRVRAARAARAIQPACPEHTSLTSQFCGDPLPGRSALDRKRAGLADPEYFDRRMMHVPRKPTLYTGSAS